VKNAITVVTRQIKKVMHVYEVRPRKDKRGVDLLSDALPFGGLWYTQVSHAIGYAKFYSRSHDFRPLTSVRSKRPRYYG
jgi:hypothetical protein